MLVPLNDIYVYRKTDSDKPSEPTVCFKLPSGFVTDVFFRVVISVLDYINYYHALALVLGPLIGTTARTCLESPAL
jgi:hypothetical protein